MGPVQDKQQHENHIKGAIKHLPYDWNRHGSWNQKFQYGEDLLMVQIFTKYQII